MDDPARPPFPRSACLTAFLATALVGSCSVAGLVLLGGFFVWLVLLVGLMAGFGVAHYLLWGRMLADQTAGEREEWEADQPRWIDSDPRRPRDE